MPCDIRQRIDITNIVRVEHSLLRQVAEEIALRGKGRVTAQTADGSTSDCGIAIHTLGLPQGIALNTQGGKRLSFEGDQYQPDYNKVTTEVQQKYVDRVIETSLRSLHFSLMRKETKGGTEYSATDLVGRQLKILRQSDGKIRFDFGDGFDDAAYHETSDAIKKALSVLGVETETTWSHKEDPEKWLEQKIAIIGKGNN
jgi:hypothetical protein